MQPIERLEPRLLLAAGALDPTFGSGGKVTTDFAAPLEAGAFASFSLPDGRVVAFGRARLGDASPLVMARFLPDGRIDPTFGKGGSAFYGFATAGAPLDAVRLPDGKLLVLSGRGGLPKTLARYTADGAVDPTFGQRGTAVLASSPDWRGSDANLAVAPDGKIVVVTSTSGDSFNAVLLMNRLTRDGAVDRSFGDGGAATLDLGDLDAIPDVAVRPDGRIVVAGSFTVVSPAVQTSGIALAQLAPHGKLDPTFGDGGSVRGRLFAVGDTVVSMALDAAGRILLVHSRGYHETGGAVARFRADGVLDRKFAERGVRKLAVQGQDVATAPDGRIVVLATEYPADSGQSRRIAVERLTATGAVDATFGTGGVTTVTLPGADDTANGVTVLPDGRVLATGSVAGAFTVIRLTAGGAVDPSYGAAGFARASAQGPGTDRPETIVVQPDGKYLVGGTSRGLDTARGTLARYNPDGSPDLTFGDRGKLQAGLGASAKALAMAPGGKILVLAEDSLRRLDARGGLDPAFASGGVLKFDFTADALVSLADGRILVAGHSGTDGTRLRRYNADGSPDRAFGTSGSLPIPGFTVTVGEIILRPDGSALLGGTVTEHDARWDAQANLWAVYRVTAAGRVDRSFGRDGAARVRVGGWLADIPYGMAVAPGGRIVLAGRISGFYNFGSSYGVARFNADGSLDRSFADGGVASDDLPSAGLLEAAEYATAVRVQDDGKVLVVGVHAQEAPYENYPVEGPPANFSDWAVFRLNADGTLDHDFGEDGHVATSFGWADSPGAAALTPDGKLVVAGAGQLPDTDADFALARYDLVDPHPITGRIEGRILKIAGTSAADVIRLRVAGGRLTVRGMSPGFPTSAFSRVEIAAGAGDDVIDASAATFPDSIDAGDGNDSVLGGSGDDSLLGGAGHDTLFGGRGHDTLRGGDGNDYLNGGRDTDRVFGDAGNDQVFAVDADVETIDGGAGFDRVKSDLDDLLTGAEGPLA
jgi:uncharacterized delta-60 repeat protein